MCITNLHTNLILHTTGLSIYFSLNYFATEYEAPGRDQIVRVYFTPPNVNLK